MAEHRFTIKDIDHCNDRIQNCLENEQIRTILEQYLRHHNDYRHSQMLKTLKLWTLVNRSNSIDDLYELIDDIDGFDTDRLLTLSELPQQIAHIQDQCCQILKNVHHEFITYLRNNHQR